jgi:hypothetical protein
MVYILFAAHTYSQTRAATPHFTVLRTSLLVDVRFLLRSNYKKIYIQHLTSKLDGAACIFFLLRIVTYSYFTNRNLGVILSLVF